MPRRSSSSETRPKKRQRTVEFVDDPEGSPPLENDKGTRPESMEDAESSENHQICLTLMCSGGRLGCAYFDPMKETVYILEDTEENNHFDLTTSILEQIAPDIVLTTSRSDGRFVDHVRLYMEGNNNLFQIRPAKEFSIRRGQERLQALPLLAKLKSTPAEDDLESRSEPRSVYDFIRKKGKAGADPTTARWNALVRLSNFYSAEERTPLCLSCIGALLDHLIRARALCDPDDNSPLETIMSIESLILDEVMQINMDALLSLQIFLDEQHASAYSDVTKEGLSIFGILNHARTLSGRALLRQWLLRPSCSMDVISTRHNTLSCFLKPDNLTTVESMPRHLASFNHVPRALARLRSGKAGIRDWHALVQFWVHSQLLRDCLADLRGGNEIELITELINLLGDGTFSEMAAFINDTIDWEESTSEGRICVRPNVDSELDTLQRLYASLDILLNRIAQDVATTSPEYKSLNVVYFPQLGFLICVPKLEEVSEADFVGMDDWTFQFASHEAIYFKSSKMRDLDQHFGDVHAQIVDREIEIIQDLQHQVLQCAEPIAIICERSAELDCLLSFANASRLYGWTRPTMCDEIVLDISQGRHPLQELVDDRFVPNDAYAVGGRGLGVQPQTRDGSSSGINEAEEEQGFLKEDGCSIVICTGANASGKSVYLKQNALICFMAQIGCFVPAASARLGIIEKMFTRIQTRESVSKMQSAFVIDLNQVSYALRNTAGPRTLIILDEFGKGTLATEQFNVSLRVVVNLSMWKNVNLRFVNLKDGAGLFCGVIMHLLNRGRECPIVFAATHFHEALNEEMLSPTQLPISFVHMAVLVTTGDGDILNDRNSSVLDLSNSQDRNPGLRPSDDVTYLFKVTQGLCLHSHAGKCALAWGIPPQIVQRAQFVSDILNQHEIYVLLDEAMSDKEREDLQESEQRCRRFLEWDLSGLIENGNFDKVVDTLRLVVNGSQVEMENPEGL